MTDEDREPHLNQALRGITLMALLAVTTIAAAALIAAVLLLVVG